MIILLHNKMVHSFWLRTCSMIISCSPGSTLLTIYVTYSRSCQGCLSVFVNKILLECGHTYTFMYIVYCFFNILAAELSSCHRNLWPTRLKIFSGPLQKNLPTPGLLSLHFIQMTFGCFLYPVFIFSLVCLIFCLFTDSVFIWPCNVLH